LPLRGSGLRFHRAPRLLRGPQLSRAHPQLKNVILDMDHMR
jgi:hypothetical protein